MSDTNDTNTMNTMNDMSESAFPSPPSSLDLSQFHHIFSQIAPRNIEQFQLLYQHWAIQQQINDVQQQIDAVQRQLAETEEQIEQVHPSAVALASLVRLQASGVEDSDLLDRMLERGEEWLDRTIQHLEYCEQLDVIRGDYEEWCRHALEDAFAWLDSMQSDTSIAPPVSAPIHEPAPPPTAPTSSREPTEEIFLQKLMSEEATHGGNDDDDEAGTGNDGEKSEGEDQDDAGDKTREEDSTPHVEEETAHKRSNFVQRFLSNLWP